MKSEKIASLFVYFSARLLKNTLITLLINVGKVFKKRHPYLLKTFPASIKSPVYCTKSRNGISLSPIYRERMNEKKNYTYHLIAIFTVGVWGLTFISTKVLIANGLSPKEIFLLRFLIAYIGIWFISPRKLFANNWKDELWLLLGGITGGSVYFLTENMALGITLATNVAFIVCTAPLLTTIFSLMIYKKEKATRTLIGGSLMALIGVAMVVYNGSFVLKISPLGDCLTLVAALSWAFYSLIMKKMTGRYNTILLLARSFLWHIDYASRLYVSTLEG